MLPTKNWLKSDLNEQGVLAMKWNRLRKPPKWMLLLSLLPSLILLSGCGGCLPSAQDRLSREELEKRRREQRDAIETVSDQVTLPTDSETKQLTAKPGHWHETQQQFKSNREDLQVVAVGSITRGSTPALIPGTNTLNDYSRRTSLPKGQTKTIDLQSFVPISAAKTDEDPFAAVNSKLNFQTELLSWPLMTPILQTPIRYPANELRPHEFQLVVVSPQALSYEYLTVLDAVYWRKDEGLTEDYRTQSYKVALVKPKENRYAVPRSMLTMTATAVVIWDDVSADDLSADQQTALIDWLHWGGQLLISGPSSWSRLQNSFLAPYLPATTAETTEFTTTDFETLSNYWLTEDMSERKSRDPLEIVGPPVAGLRLNLNERGQWLPHSGELVAESQVGRGRIVMTAYPMREPRIYRWKYYGSFFSSGLLRRYPRTVIRTPDERLLAQVWEEPFQNSILDPRLHSNFRILSRDLPLSNRPGSRLATDAVTSGEAGSVENRLPQDEATAPALAQETNRNFALAPESPREELRWGGGGGTWNDFSGLSYQAIIALKAAAGIELPSRTTILYLLGGYLLCLVPLNWLVFRSIQRLEFAWVAAPIMALIGVVVVTKVASLDIGFARRTTEVSLLELHGDHPRGHLTKFLALYTSLSTNYAVEFAENDSVALPLGDFGRTQARAAASVKNMRTAYGRSEGVRLEPVTVYSNSTEMLHAEQLVTLPGSLSLGSSSTSDDAIRNQTGLDLKAAVVVRCVEDGRIEIAWIGELASGQVAAVQFEASDLTEPIPQWSDNLSTQPIMPSQSSDEEVDTLWVGGILREVLVKTPLVPGQTRLVGYTDNRPGKLEVLPTSDQFDGRCVVVAHLTPQSLGDILPDKKILSKIASAFGQPSNIDDLREESGATEDAGNADKAPNDDNTSDGNTTTDGSASDDNTSDSDAADGDTSS